jgi:hypothetical protein
MHTAGRVAAVASQSGSARHPGVLSEPARARRGLHAAIAAARANARPATGAVSLVGLAAGSLFVVLAAAERPSFLAPLAREHYFPAWMAGPLRGLLPSLTHNYDSLAWLISALMAAMYVLYVLAFANAPRLPARWTIATVIALHAIFLVSPPLSFTDIFNYINYGRMGVVHGLNPYTTIPQLEPHGDPSFSLSNWHYLLSPYGPLFTLFTYALVPLGVVASYWVVKCVLALASLATLALVWRCAKLLGRSPSAAVVLVGCNPIILVWGLGGDHNDSLMLLFVVLATYLLLRAPASPRASMRAGVALVTGVFIKASAAVLLPILLLAAQRRRFLLGALAAGAALALASALAFGANLPGLSTQSQVVTTLGVPNLLGYAFGQGGETATVRTLVSVALVIAIVVSAYRVWRGRSHWTSAAAVVLLALIASLSWEVPWYLLWALPFAALSPSRRVRVATLMLGVYLLLTFIPAESMLAEAIHFKPGATSVAKAHRHEIERLVR